MAKTKLKGSAENIAEYRAERRKVLRRIRDIRSRGYTLPENFAPKIPKQIKPESIRNLQKYTTEYIYRHAVFTSPEGVSISGTERRAQERSEASKRAAETRARNIQEQYYERQAQVKWEKLTQDIRINRPELVETPASEMQIIFDNFINDFNSWQPSNWWSDDLKTFKTRDKDKALGILTGAINAIGREQVARNIAENSTEIISIQNKILYESGNKYRVDSREGEINLALNRLAALLYGRPLTIKESMQLTSEAEANEAVIKT